MPETATLAGQRPVLDTEVLAEIAALASSVDCSSDADRRPTLRRLSEVGALGLGLPGSGASHLDQVHVLASMAGACMTSAFSAWAHRMTVEYLVRFAGPELADTVEEVRTGRTAGSTALAATFRAAAGHEELPVSIDRTDGNARASGFVSWASNLYEDSIVVVGVRDGDRNRMAVFRVSDEGVKVNAVTGLLALDASRSGSIVLDGVVIPEESFLPEPFESFVSFVRPAFLAFQVALCLGLSAASLEASREPRGLAVSLLPKVTDETKILANLQRQLTELATWLDHRTGEIPVHPVRLRLEAAHLAGRATQLELAVRGGAAYAADSPTARRVREALFLPVQSPTEAQLQWELQHQS